MLKEVVIALILFLCSCGTTKHVAQHSRQNQGFKTSQIYTGAGPTVSRLTPKKYKSNQLLRQLFKQEFTYLGKGMQILAFLSADGEYVLKLCRYNPFKPHWASYYPIRLFYPAPHQQWMNHLEKDFKSYRLAYESLRNETGLVHLHLQQTRGQYPTVVLHDKLGHAWKVDLDEVYFIVQKRADWIIPTLDKLLKEGNMDQARQRLAQLFDMIAARCQKGIKNRDFHFYRNSGFLSDQAIDIDVSQFEYDEAAKKPEMMSYLIRRNLDEGLLQHVKETHPQLIPLIEEQLNRLK
jgi:hypothetical protein